MENKHGAQEARPVGHRSNTVKAAIHIVEFSTADPVSKINAALVALYPDDLKVIESRIAQALKDIEAKI